MSYRTGFFLNRAIDGAFEQWYREHDGLYEELTSPEVSTTFAFSRCVPSWNASLPDGSWLEVLLRVRSGNVWTSWRSMGVWAPDESIVKRHSSVEHDDDVACVETDTLVVASLADTFQARFRFRFGVDSAYGAAPSGIQCIHAFALAYTDAKLVVTSGNGEGTLSACGLAGHVVPGVPRCSQMIYPDGGTVWCSPTSVAMVLGHWLGDTEECEHRVRAAVGGVYDHAYEGYGNWSFNVAYAGSIPGIEAYVACFAGLDRLEPWIQAGVPVILSVSWDNDHGRILGGAPIPRSNGHLTTLVGFDDAGDAVMNEPASPSNEAVRRVYDRHELEARWLAASGGAAYLIYPSASGTDDKAALFARTIG
jgi:hypothetical protein